MNQLNLEKVAGLTTAIYMTIFWVHQGNALDDMRWWKLGCVVPFLHNSSSILCCDGVGVVEHIVVPLVVGRGVEAGIVHHDGDGVVGVGVDRQGVWAQHQYTDVHAHLVANTLCSHGHREVTG